ncbi:MAG TPA: Hsp20/alpha crystallin family protein [Candidatus Methylomirabilis sp.]|nr:Hsp20/alpha crystallin family protein [Candidatus Methylomirabilis sp.]HSC71449.1 Hsp20/alpha crystallin family protein [Candidatus Methylomirabilis sp.]
MGVQPWPGPGWYPLSDLAVIKQEMGRLFESFLGLSPGYAQSAEGVWAPPMDVCETRDEIRVLVELPGVSQSQIALEIVDGVLAIKGERQPDPTFRQDQLLRMECHYGPFGRRLNLPSVIDPDQVRATYRNGVLEVRLPKRAEARSQSITVEAT